MDENTLVPLQYTEEDLKHINEMNVQLWKDIIELQLKLDKLNSVQRPDELPEPLCT